MTPPSVGLGGLDFPAVASALWALYDKGGPRPEYVLPVLYSESGFSTSITNSINCVGINQLCPPNVPDGYASWSASQQIAGVVTPYMLAYVHQFGPLNSGTRVYQANFLPGTLPYAKSLSSTLATQGSSADVCPGCHLSQAAVYHDNPGLDWQHKGSIVLGDLSHFIAKAASAAAVQSAISQTYALRPSESPNDPVYGTDFGSAANPSILEIVGYSVGILGVATATALAIRELKMRRALERRPRRRLREATR
jgi:hypothetical protein